MSWKIQLELFFLLSIFFLLPGTAREAVIPELSEYARISDPGVVESSGIAVSRKFGNVFWTHNDDGPSTIFAVGLDGKGIRSYELPVRQHDWEDIASDQEGNLYLLDNTSEDDEQHRTVIHVFREPNPYRDESVGPVETFEVSYQDSGHDTEALFVWQSKVFLVTKPWDGSKPRIYVADNRRDSVADFLGSLSYGAMITGGDISEDGSLIGLSSYRALFIFEGKQAPEKRLLGDPLVCKLNAGQVEGISWRGTDLILTNEQGSIFWIEESKWRVREAPFQPFPEIQVPYYSPGSLDQALPSEWDRGTWLCAVGLPEMGRVAWSEKGLHIGIRLPEGLEIPSLDTARREDLDHWFTPGRVYVLINPAGDRQLSFGSNDRCIVVGEQADDGLSCEVRTLLPATYIQSVVPFPPWITLQRKGRWLLVTAGVEGPGLYPMAAGRTMGFNLVVIGETGKTLSWAPLTLDFSWDAPSFWGLIELVE